MHRAAQKTIFFAMHNFFEPPFRFRNKRNSGKTRIVIRDTHMQIYIQVLTFLILCTIHLSAQKYIKVLQKYLYLCIEVSRQGPGSPAPSDDVIATPICGSDSKAAGQCMRERHGCRKKKMANNFRVDMTTSDEGFEGWVVYDQVTLIQVGLVCFQQVQNGE